MPTLKANHRIIAAARPIGGKRTRYRIEDVDGLWLDVGPRSSRVWYVRYQPGGRMTRSFRYYKIGPLEQVSLAVATRRAKEIIGEVYGKQRDPQAERVARNKQGTTFGDLFEDWFARHAEPMLARAETDRIIYRCHIEGGFSKRRIVDLRRIEIGRFRDKVAREASPLTSNSVVDLAARLRKVGIKRPRERVLSEADMPKFWSALAAMETMTGEHMARAEKGRMLSPATRSILRLLLLTGQRRSEVVEARKLEFELDGSEPVWTIPGARTKNRLLHRLPLCPMAAAEFRRAIAASPEESPFVFPSPEDPLMRPISAEAVTRAMARMVAEMKIPTVSPHDLRRTVGTEMAKLGLPVHVRSLVLNHSPMSRGITDAVYNRYAYDKEKREALKAWEERLTRLLAHEPPQALNPAEAA